MRAPKRWVEDGGSATEVERDLLREGLKDEPPPGAKGAVWAGVLASLAIPTAVVGSSALAGATGTGKGAAVATGVGAAKAGSGVAAASGAAGAGMLKAVAIGAVSAVVTFAGYTAVAPYVTSPPPSATTTKATATPSTNAGRPAQDPRVVAPAASGTAEEDGGTAEQDGGTAETATVIHGKPAASVAYETALRDESQRLGEARDVLRRGDASGALALLEKLRVRYPAGVLGQEREALTIEALYRAGRRNDAATRAAAFLAAHPGSPFADRVQAFH